MAWTNISEMRTKPTVPVLVYYEEIIDLWTHLKPKCRNVELVHPEQWEDFHQWLYLGSGIYIKPLEYTYTPPMNINRAKNSS